MEVSGEGRGRVGAGQTPLGEGGWGRTRAEQPAGATLAHRAEPAPPRMGLGAGTLQPPRGALHSPSRLSLPWVQELRRAPGRPRLPGEMEPETSVTQVLPQAPRPGPQGQPVLSLSAAC